MARVELHTIHAENFMAFREAHLNFDRQGLVYLVGQHYANTAYDSNHAGKSTLISMHPWCVWGEVTKDLLNVSDVITDGEKSCCVREEGTIDGRPYFVERRRTKRETEILTNLTGSDRLTGDYQREIESFLGTYRLATNTTILGQGRALAFLSGVPAVRKTILEDLLRLDRYRDAAKRITKDLADYRTLRAEVTATIQTLQTILDQRIRELTHLEQMARKEIEAQVALLWQQGAEYEARLSDVAREDRQLSEERAAWIEKWQPQLPQPGSGSLRQERDSMVRPIQEGEARLKSIQQSYALLCGGGPCPTCQTPITDTSPILATLRSEAMHLEADLNQYRFEFEAVEQTLAEVVAYEAAYDAALYGFTTRHEELVKRYRSWEALRDEAFRAGKALTETLEQIAAPYTDEDVEQMATQQQRIDHLTGIVRMIDDVVPYLKFWQTGFSHDGLPARLVADVLPLLNHHHQTLMDRLVDGQLNSTTNVDLSLSVTENGRPIPYDRTSDGQRRRMVIALFLAMADTQMETSGLSWNVRFVDELFDVLDTTGIHRVLQLFSTVASRQQTVVVASQRTEMRHLDCFDAVWTIVNDAGARRVEVETR